MDFFPTQNHKHPQSDKNHNNKKRLSQEQVKLLERSFTANKKLGPELKLQLASQLGVPPRQVAIWYQNKRARWKTQSLELDYNTLQVKLENVMAEKRRLEKDVKHLQEELRKAQEMLQLIAYNNNSNNNNNNGNNNNNNNNYSSNGRSSSISSEAFCNSSEEGGGSSGLRDYRNVHDEEVLPLDELYACLIGANCRSSTAWG